METLFRGYVVGTFYGYKGGRVYRLSDGNWCLQDDYTDEPLYCQSPRAKILRDPASGTIYLDVMGASAIVKVLPLASKRISQRA